MKLHNVPWMLEGAASHDTGLINGSKLLNLILYSSAACYDMMADALEKYLIAKSIEHYFYSFREDLDVDHLIVGSHLYIRGTETFLPACNASHRNRPVDVCRASSISI